MIKKEIVEKLTCDVCGEDVEEFFHSTTLPHKYFMDLSSEFSIYVYYTVPYGISNSKDICKNCFQEALIKTIKRISNGYY